MEKKYRNTGFFTLLLIPLTFAGYYKSYISQIPHFNDYIKSAHHIHALLALLWLALLISQSLLLRYRHVATHKRVGRLSYGLFALLILSFFPIIHSDSIIIFPITDMTLLIVFYSLGIFYKKEPSVHMRYMICLSLVFLDPTLGRVVFNLATYLGHTTLAVHHITLGTIVAILLGLILFDRANHRNYKPYILALSLFLVYQISFQLIYVRS